MPWRDTKDPWWILVSEIMLQQTRVETVLPYFRRFVALFPDPVSLASAAEEDVLTAWSGLGYYLRARNLQKAARAIVASGGFPNELNGIRALPGVGAYTSGAVASIAFGIPVAALDGNVLRVLARVLADFGEIGSPETRRRFAVVDGELLDPSRPGDFNQAMMELGATVCLPRTPHCLVCPVARDCGARQQRSQGQLPVKAGKKRAIDETLSVVVAVRRGAVLLKLRAQGVKRMASFWELPGRGDLEWKGTPEAAGSFSHTIVNTRFLVEVFQGEVTGETEGLEWRDMGRLSQIPLTTIARKALSLVEKLKGRLI